MLPQPEPLFDTEHFTTETFKNHPVKKEYANMVFLADLSNESSYLLPFICFCFLLIFGVIATRYFLEELLVK